MARTPQQATWRQLPIKPTQMYAQAAWQERHNMQPGANNRSWQATNIVRAHNR